MTRDVDVFVDLPGGRTLAVGHLAAQVNAGGVLVASRFEYAESFLRDPSRYELCPELPLTRGPITAMGGRVLAGCFTDSGPDRWGRNLLFAAESRAAAREGRPVDALTDLDFVVMTNDETRQGALRYSVDAGRTFASPARDFVPSMVELPALVDAARRHANHRETDTDLDLLTRAGTSMGGARPKATVRTDAGRLAIAKLPDVGDRWNVLAWEATALELARRARVQVPEFELHRLSPDTAVLVADRFDRDATGSRVGYLSGHSLVQQGPNDTIAYTDLADVLAGYSEDPDSDGAELFRRVTLSLLVNNVDDHMRNHGVVRGVTGWRLSPVFDVNPFPARWQVASTPLTPGGDGTHRDIGDLVDLAGNFGLARTAAITIVAEVQAATSLWADVAAGFGIEPDEITFMGSAFESENRETARRVVAAADIDTRTMDLTPPRRGWVGPHVRNGRQVRGYRRTT